MHQLAPLVALALGGSPLTLADAVTELEAHGFDLRAAEQAVAQARADVRAAGAVPNPTVSFSIGPALGCFGPGCRSGSPTVQAQLQDTGAVSQLLSGKRALRVDASEAALRSGEATRLDVRRQVLSAFKQQFVAALIAERSAAFSSEVSASTGRTEEIIKARFRAGSVDDADVARVETQHLEAEQALDASLQNLTQQRSLVAYLLGRPSESPGLDLDGATFTRSQPVPALDSASLETLISTALSHRPDVQAQVSAVEQAEAALRLARRQRLPDVQPFVQFGEQGWAPDYSSPPYLSFGLAVPLPVYFMQGEIARAVATVDLQQVGLAKVRAQVRTDVEASFAAFASARAQARRMEQGGLLDSAGRARDLVNAQYEKGTASLLEILDAQRTFVATHQEYLQVVQSYWSAVFRLEAAVGQEWVR